jgi:hypothetical protein
MAHELDGKQYFISEVKVLSHVVEDVLFEENLLDCKDIFHVLVDGEIIDPSMWDHTAIVPDSNVLISPKIQGGTFGQVFKQVAVVLVAAAVTYFSAGTLGSVGAALLGSVAAFGTTLALNALIPAPGLGLGGVGDAGDAEKSQMYVVGSQSNSINKYGSVSKGYGTHRTFPPVVANPYTDIEVDQSTKELVQFFYAIYDFGHGPLEVKDIKIGETPISDFSDFEYNLVDLNKPLTSEGPWDDELENNFKLYRGDVSVEALGTFINKNQADGGAAEDYQISRTTKNNPNNKSAEISIAFVNPSGLIAYGPDGTTAPRNIEVRVEFRKVGEVGWNSFNDLAVVENFYTAGGSEVLLPILLAPYATAVGPLFGPSEHYTRLQSYDMGMVRTSYFGLDGGGQSVYISENIYRTKRIYGIPQGSTRVKILRVDPAILLEKFISYDAKIIGRVQSVTIIDATYMWVNLYAPLVQAIQIASWVQQDIYSAPRFITPPIYQKTTWVLDGTVNSPNYTPPANVVNGVFTISREETGQVYSSLKFRPRDYGQFEIRVTRVRSYSNKTQTIVDDLVVQSLTTRIDSEPILTKNRHTFLELKIRATNQLNGAIQNLSGVVTSVLDVYDEGAQTWIKQPTNNPAWIYCDLLTGPVNKKKLDKSRLHLPSILEWAAFCDEVPVAPPNMLYIYPRFQCNFLLDYNTTLAEVINKVTNSCQASLNIVDGKYGVLLDIKKDIPVQVFTPRNSSGFNSTRNYINPPNGLKISFISPVVNWDTTETIVYDDGFDEVTAETFEEFVAFGCTNAEQAWRYGRYMIAQGRLRQETISLTVDFENLVCTRGDYVRISQDVMKVGGVPARVKSTSGNIVTLDDSLVIDSSLPLGYLVRGVDGIFSDSCVLLSADTIQVAGDIPLRGDLIIVGEMGKVWYDCLVKSINPNDDQSAQIILVEKADAIYDAESSGSLPDYDPQITGLREVDVAPNPVTDLTVANQYWTCGANDFVYYILIDWEVPTSTAYEYFEVYADSGKGYNLVGETKESEFLYNLNSDRVDNLHKFKVVPVSASGKKKELIEAIELEVVPAKKLERPENIAKLSTNITGEVLQLDWEPSKDCIREYLIRYSTSLNGTWESSIPLLRVDKNTTMASTQARTGTYLIKAVDFYDNESMNPTVAITTIPELFNLNFISMTNDFPDVLGTKVRTEKVGGTLVLKTITSGGVDTNEYYSEGYYYYQGFLDLGEIYTVRLQSLIQAEGYTIGDIMANWITLAEVEALSRSRFSEWDVQTEYRSTERFNVIADWPSLDVIDPLSEGYQELWTDWRKITVNDATGRIFQFRLKLISNKPSVTPRVFNGQIKADMPDRVESYPNILSDVDGESTIIYSPAFKGPSPSPSIQISMENGQTGDYWQFLNKDLDGFTIKFFDKDGVPVQRRYDAQIKGYGRKALSVI